nr:putative l-type lectin-domain containing receptor kinase s.5 [Quercus suber]
MCFSQVVWSLLLAVLLGGALTQVGCLDFNFSTFKKEDEHNLIITEGTTILLNAIQVTPDVANDPITNYSGRIFYSKPFRLWSKSKKITASFNTTFDLKITPDLSPKQSPVGEGMAFILAADTTLPQKSEGQWLGIVNASTNGSHQAKIVAVEFDTRKSYKEDIDDNHVGLDVNSIHSIEQVSLTKYGIKLNETYLYGAIKVRVQYDGKVMNVSAKTNKTSEYKLIFSLPLELSSYLPEKVFVGFSASTGNAIQTNCLKTWEFHSSHIDDEELEMLWVWITVPVVLIVLSMIVFYLYWQNKHREQPEDAYPRIEDQIQGSSMAPQKFKFKDLRKATGNFNPKNKLGKDRFIYGSEELGMDEPTLGWERRHTIIYGVAQALDYLHDGCEKRVLHRDIKASNIMLDSEFNAKLGDFGLARTLQQSENTHHTTKVIAGTLGYMAPETFLTGRATVETDVYAFGVLVLEVASGRKPGNQNGQSDYNNNIVHWLWDLHRQERILDAIDSRLT